MRPSNAVTARLLRFAPLALATTALVACGGGSSGSPPTGTIAGTAAVGAPMANAKIQMACKNGGTSVTADANGAYTATFPFDGPCEIMATSGSTALHSCASGPGTFNVSPLTELLLNYLAARLNTTLSGLLAGIATNPTYQSALTNSTVIASAEQAVVTVIQQAYPGVKISATSFLTIPFVPGQPADMDLDNLQAAGAIQPDGTPTPSLVTTVIAAGVAAGPITTTGGTGATGGTGTTTP